MVQQTSSTHNNYMQTHTHIVVLVSLCNLSQSLPVVKKILKYIQYHITLCETMHHQYNCLAIPTNIIYMMYFLILFFMN